MKKKIVTLVVAVIILILLVCVYILTSNMPNEAENNNISDETTSEATVDAQGIIDTFDDIKIGNQITNLENVTNFTIINNMGVITFELNDNKWFANGYNNNINQSKVNSALSILTDLYVDGVVEENATDFAKFGLDNPVATLTSATTIVMLGDTTPDGKYYYVRVSSDNNIYLMPVILGKNLLGDIKSFIDTSLPSINIEDVQYMNLKGREIEEISLKYDKDNPIAKDYAKRNGLPTLIMEKPLADMLVYPMSLQYTILKNFSSLNLGNVYDINPSDLSIYGLDNPLLELRLEDSKNAVYIKAGNTTIGSDNKEYIYIMVNNRQEVFLVNYDSLRDFAKPNIADFVDRFISIYQRSLVSNISINTGSEDINISFVSKGKNKITNIDGVDKDNRIPYINDKKIDKEDFTKFYEMLVGISFDNIDRNAQPKGEPKLTITFNLEDGESSVAEYFEYDANFLLVKKGESHFAVVSKQTVNKVISRAKELIS